MGRVVSKFGGSSLADTDLIRTAARRAIATKESGNDVIVVVSAMGNETDRLYDLANELMENPPPRELDMLVSTGEQVTISLMSIAIQSLGHDAISFIGGQIGIRTDGYHSKAKILDISQRGRVDEALKEGKIVIVAGFQGVDEDLNITTLGRGGSDTSAVALAAVFGADVCEINKDVDGVCTADPRIVPDAKLMDKISYDEMLELAGMGAGVLHSRSVELAKKHRVPLRVRSSFNETPGTLVCELPADNAPVVRGATFNVKESKVTLCQVPDRPGVASTILQRIAERNINVDMIIQNPGHEGITDLAFTVPKLDLPETMEVLSSVSDEIGASEVVSQDDIAKISVIGSGMQRSSGVAFRMFNALASEGINIENISTSEIRISCIVKADDCERSLRAAHAAFELGKVE